MTWTKGQSGNPGGRKPGSGKVEKLRKKLEAHIPAVLDALVEMAKEGDTSAIKILLERVMPALKPVEQPVTIPLGDTLTDAGENVLKAAGAGTLAPGTASQLIQAVVGLARVRELEALEDRIAQLEQRSAG